MSDTSITERKSHRAPIVHAPHGSPCPGPGPNGQSQCGAPVHRRGLCGAHDMQRQRRGDSAALTPLGWSKRSQGKPTSQSVRVGLTTEEKEAAREAGEAKGYPPKVAAGRFMRFILQEYVEGRLRPTKRKRSDGQG